MCPRSSLIQCKGRLTLHPLHWEQGRERGAYCCALPQGAPLCWCGWKNTAGLSWCGAAELLDIPTHQRRMYCCLHAHTHTRSLTHWGRHSLTQGLDCVCMDGRRRLVEWWGAGVLVASSWEVLHIVSSHYKGCSLCRFYLTTYLHHTPTGHLWANTGHASNIAKTSTTQDTRYTGSHSELVHC